MIRGSLVPEHLDSGCRWSPRRRRSERVDRETGRAAPRARLFRVTRFATLDNRRKLVYDGQRGNTKTVQVRVFLFQYSKIVIMQRS